MSDLLIPDLEEDLRARLERLARSNGIGTAEQAHDLLRDAVFAKMPVPVESRKKRTLAEALAEWRKTLPEDWEGFHIPRLQVRLNDFTESQQGDAVGRLSEGDGK